MFFCLYPCLTKKYRATILDLAQSVALYKIIIVCREIFGGGVGIRGRTYHEFSAV